MCMKFVAAREWGETVNKVVSMSKIRTMEPHVTLSLCMTDLLRDLWSAYDMLRS